MICQDKLLPHVWSGAIMICDIAEYQQASKGNAPCSMLVLLYRARKVTAAASQEALHAATQQAESMVQHKARMRQSHIAAQTPLPQQGAKAAPTEAQQRLSTAAEPKRVGCCITSCKWLLVTCCAMLKTDCFGKTRLVPHVPSSS